MRPVKVYVGHWIVTRVMGRFDVVGVTLGNRIFFGEEPGFTLLKHEMIHVGQYARLGLVGFLMRYFGDLLVQFIKWRSIKIAYRNISLEVEAYARQGEPLTQEEAAALADGGFDFDRLRRL